MNPPNRAAASGRTPEASEQQHTTSCHHATRVGCALHARWLALTVSVWLGIERHAERALRRRYDLLAAHDLGCAS